MEKAKEPGEYNFGKKELDLDDIIEIYNLFAEVMGEVSIQINDWKLENIAEIHQIKEPFTKIQIVADLFKSKYSGGNFLIYDKDMFFLRISNKQDIILLGLKTKIEEIIKKRERIKKQSSIINQTKNVPILTQNGFWKRNKDQIIIGIIVAVIGLVIAYFFGLIGFKT